MGVVPARVHHIHLAAEILALGPGRKGKAVRLGITAPAEVAVRRQEVPAQRQAVAAGALPAESHC